MNLPAQQNQAPQLPAHLQQFQSRKLSQTVAANIGTSAPPYISIAGNRFTLVDAAGNEQPVPTYDPQIGVYLDCVVFDIGDNLSKVYYDVAYDPNAQTYQPPGCWSDNGVGPSRQASKPQSLTCATCQWAVWGSATSKVSGKGVKACHDSQKVAVYVPGFPVMFLLRIPPNSLKNFRMYSEQFNGQQFDMDALLTRLSFEPNGVGTLKFQSVNYIDENAAIAIMQARAAKSTDSLVGRLDVPIAALPAPAAEQAPPAQQAQPGFAAQPGAPQVPPAQPTGWPAGGQVQGAPQAPFQGQPAQTAGAPAAPLNFAPPGQPVGFPTQQATQPMPSPASAPTASPSEPKRRGRRAAAAPATPQSGSVQAPFPQAAPAQQHQFAPQPAPAAPPAAQPTFGVQPGVAPNPELAAMLATAFPNQGQG